MYVKRSSEYATIPTRGSFYSAGLDLYSAVTTVLYPSERMPVETHIHIAVPEGMYGRIAPRSGIAVKHGIDVLAGVIDPDYRGEVKVVLINHGKENFFIRKGDRIAQLILEKVSMENPVEVRDLPNTERGDSGFGSTGV
jgi:dUTP pyrophosphatase